jgi:hypothetical protein
MRIDLTQPSTSPQSSCEACGAPMSGQFCAQCGLPATIPQQRTSGPEVVGTAAVANPRVANGRRRVWVVAALVALAVVAAAAVLVTRYISTSDQDSASGTQYRVKLSAAFSALLGTNAQLSRELRALSGTNTSRARDAVTAAQRAMATTSGALDALAPPDGEQQMATNAREVVAREDAFLSAVDEVLADPNNPSRSELATLQSNLQSAFIAAGPVVAGTAPPMTGASELATWAAHVASRSTASPQPQSSQPASAPASTGAPINPYANGRDCGDGVYAGANTSCAFAMNVRQAWYEAPGLVNAVSVYSPVTGVTYQMDCAPSGAAVTCSGGNDASVTFGE